MSEPYYADPMVALYQGDVRDVLRGLPDESVQTVVTSPPYFSLRDYGVTGQLGLEDTPTEYVSVLVDVFREVRRVLRDDGTAWINLGDSYAAGGKGGGGSFMAERRDGSWQKQSSINGWRSAPEGLKPKDLVGIPWMVAFALRADGWYLRQDIIWAKPNAMPESVQDRCTKAHEYLFLLSKSERYHYDGDAIREPSVGVPGARNSFARATSTPMVPTARTLHHRPERDDVRYEADRNRRSVWTIPTAPFPEAHFATFPPNLVRPCILAGAPEGGVVLDPFVGSGTTAMVAKSLGRRAIGIDLNPEYLAMARRRVVEIPLPMMAAMEANP